MKKLLLTAMAFTLTLGTAANLSADNHTLKSPDGKTEVRIKTSRPLTYSIYKDGALMVDNSPVSISLDNGKTIGKEKVKHVTERSVDNTIQTPLYKKAAIQDKYNEIIFECKNTKVIFRAYDSGIAWRGEAVSKKPVKVKSDNTVFHFPDDWRTILSYSPSKGEVEAQFSSTFENMYSISRISEMGKDRLAFLPAIVQSVEGKKICIAESDLINYPGMFLKKSKEKNTLEAVFATYPNEIYEGGNNGYNILVKSRKNHIAQFDSGELQLPWRIITVADKDKELLDNDLVYTLAAAPAEDINFDWVRPGKVAWEKWNDRNITGVDFLAGINDATYKHYIDFAHENGLEYVILDEGWSVPAIHVAELVEYAAARNVGIILWSDLASFSRNTEELCRHYSKIGVKGFKVDCIERDDQMMVDFMYAAAAIAADNHLILDFHGCAKPAGLNRTWPNVLNFEAVYGLENLKKTSNADIVVYDVTMPFIRMYAGPVDYTPGAMRNATMGNWRAINTEPMSQGTRCHQLAEYIVFEAPLEMLCDSPSAYRKEQECTDFIASLPTVWDETIALDGKIGEFAAIARRKGEDWYVGALNNWTARSITLDLTFLPEGEYEVELFRDGVNAHRAASDYAREVKVLPQSRTIEVPLAPGGGTALRVKPVPVVPVYDEPVKTVEQPAEAPVVEEPVTSEPAAEEPAIAEPAPAPVEAPADSLANVRNE